MNMLTYVFKKDKKDYDQIYAKLKDAQIKCAELLIKQGLKLSDLTSK